MVLVQAIILAFKETRKGVTDKQRSWESHEFYAHETDRDGARIPVVLSTMNKDVMNLLMNLKDQETMIPFVKSSEYGGKKVYQVDESILRMAKE